MSKKILGLDLGTNSIGWALVDEDFENKTGNIEGLGSRIIPMSQDILGKFDAGQSHSQTADRTSYRGTRRLYHRNNMRRERLHRVLNILGFLPKHYANSIDFEDKLGQFKAGIEIKLNYCKNEEGKHEFIFMDAFNEMIVEFKKTQPQLFYTKNDGEETKIPHDWTLYYLRKKALTHKITKEELAWLILNFNQKRGYYQLRGEETETDNSKIEEYYNLKVNEVQETQDKNTKGTWYNVILENGWIYRRQSKESLNVWVGKHKEFIVTTQLDKDGNHKLDKDGDIKRSFRSVDSEKDWIAIKAKTEQDIEHSEKTVGEYIYQTLLRNPKQKIRGKLVKTIERKFYKNEYKQILSKQIELQPELFKNELYKSCIKELYPRNESHQNSIKGKGFLYLFIDDIIFYQRPLKSQKSSISGCQLEYRVYKKRNDETGNDEIIKEPVKAIPKSHPLFQEFRIWQWLKNLRIYNKDEINNGQLDDLTIDLLKTEQDWVELFDFLNTKNEAEQKHIIEYFVKKKLIDKKDKDSYRWNYVEDKKYPFAQTHVQFVNRLKKVSGIDDADNFLTEKTKVGLKAESPNLSREEQLWHIIYSVTDINDYKSALEKYALKHKIDIDSFVKNFIKFSPFSSDYGNYSKKALDKLLPLMRMGKYWEEKTISLKVRDRVSAIMERVNALNLKADYSDKDLKVALAHVSDDDIPKQLVKSFHPFKDKNPTKGLNTYQATYLIYGRHSELGDIQHWNTSGDIDKYLNKFKQHALRNPIVEQVVTETLRVVSDIWNYYGNGKNGFFDEIHVELGREMKNPANKREKIARRIIENENTNYRIKEILKELMNDTLIKGDVKSYSSSQQELLKIYEEGIYQDPNAKYDNVTEDEISKIRKNNNPSKKEIQRYQLWLEQGYVSPYTGEIIKLSELFTEKYQIEHVIPQSRYFDNSLSNKVICESDINPYPYKGNQTGYEFIKNMGGQVVPELSNNGKMTTIFSLEEYENHVTKYFAKNTAKLKYLLSEDIPEGFINRQMNDSRYISKLIKGLLSNIVRTDNEQEATSKNLLPVTGAVTSKLKQDWGLNDKWNEIIAPRFKRLNNLTQTNNFGYWDKKINAFRIQVPDNLSKGFNRKRIDHRHHALDALIVACITRDHSHYLSALNTEKENYSLRNKLLRKNNQDDFTKHFQMPWLNFTTDAKQSLEEIIISFKQNNRVINKANNKFWSYNDENGNLNIGKDGKPKKKLRKQTKGDNWAIRKGLHKETISGIYNIDTPKGKIATSVRTSLSEIKNEKHLDKITDKRIREVILPNHLRNYLDEKGKPNYDIAFSQEGIEDLNKNIVALNNGKKHQPIFKVKMYEVGSKFSVSEEKTSAKNKKYVEAAKGTNLFFTIYWDEEKQKRNYDTVPLNEVISHQKEVAKLPKEIRTPIQPKAEKGKFLFTLSPNDLVYVPTEEEIENPHIVDFNNLNKEQVRRIYKMVSSSGNQCFFILSNVANTIKNKSEFSALNKMEKSIDNLMIKERCWKLKVDRLGNIIDIIKG